MKPMIRFRPLCLALALGMAVNLTARADDAQTGALNIDASPVSTNNLDARLKVNDDPKLFAYNQVMYLYNTGHNFEALNQLLLDKSTNVLPESDIDSEILLGNLYTMLGLADQADAVFTRAISNDTIAATRNLTWFNKGKLQFQRGNYDAAKKIFTAPQNNLTGDYDSQRRIMLANILCKNGSFSEARHVLSTVPLNSIYGAYATYNMGIANLRALHYPEGIAILTRLMNMPAGNSESNTLKDRAALAIGFTYLQRHQSENAQQALVNIRLDGPFSNQALLALGYAHFDRNEYKKALSFWMELQKRNPSDPYVQETLLLTPRAFEALGALPQSMTSYREATDVLRKQIVTVDALITAMQDPQWLEVLAPDGKASLAADPLQPMETTAASNKGETLFLYKLLASNDFNEAFKQYQQLRRLQLVMDKRANDLLALKDVANTLNTVNGHELDIASQRISELKARYLRMQQHWEAVQVAAQDAGSNNEDFASIATDADQRREHYVAAMMAALDKQPPSPAVQKLKQRAKRLHGMSIWIEATDAPVAQDDLLKRLQDTDKDMVALQKRLQAVQSLVDNNHEVIASNPDSRVDKLIERVSKARDGIKTAQEEYREYMRKQALNVLQQNKVKLSNELAEAYLNLARIEDEAINKDDKAPSSSKEATP